jgi:geranylgeranyl diphosphate synthase, type II
MKAEVLAYFDRVRPAIDAALDSLLPSESTSPAQIHRAMRYSVFAGGKRLRPALCLAGYAIFHNDPISILPVAAAIEMVHTYSLIHDDLPAMDDDDFRRGVPSCHKKFGEATAILAGDALLTLAFETMTNCPGFSPTAMLRATAELARALGTRNGMIAGQVLDLEAEGQLFDKDHVDAIHAAKTGALISTSVWMGAYLGGASDSEAKQVLAYGKKIGLAFQIVDDMLDETESGETLGKTAGKDREHRKATYPAVLGLDQSRRIVRQLTEEARQFVEPLGAPSANLIEIAGFLEKRCH